MIIAFDGTTNRTLGCTFARDIVTLDLDDSDLCFAEKNNEFMALDYEHSDFLLSG